MDATEMSIPHQNRPDLVDQQYQEVAAARTAVLNRELVRMRSEGWNAQLSGDHLIASRKEAGRSQLERVLICVAAFLAIAYVAKLVAPGTVEGVSTAVYFGGAVVLGAIAALLTGGQSARTRTVKISVDGQGRPYMSDA